MNQQRVSIPAGETVILKWSRKVAMEDFQNGPWSDFEKDITFEATAKNDQVSATANPITVHETAG